MPYRVLELGTHLAGPLLGRHLADLGLEVIAVVRPATARGAARERRRVGAMRAHLERGKTIVPLDLPREDAQLRELLAAVDVVVTNFGPGVAERRGFGAARCLAINPALVYVHLPGYASADACPPAPAWDSVIMATSGVFCDMGLNRTLLGVEASFSPLPLASVYASIFGCVTVLGALLEGRRGVTVEVPLASALSEALVHNSLRFPLDPCYMNARARALRAGRTALQRDELDVLLDPFFRGYACADGRTIYLVCPAHVGHQRRAVEVLGVADEVLRLAPPTLPYGDAYTAGLGCGSLSDTQAAAVRPVLARAFLERPSAEWERRLGAAGVPAVAHRTTEEWMAHPHARASGLVAADGGLAPIGWLRDARAVPPAAAPARPADLRVLDLTNVIAGPTVGQVLARLGCTVIKVDPPRPSYAPDVAVVYGLATNVGKQSVLLDIFHAQGRATLEALVRTVDVVVVNCTPACLARARLTRDDVARLNPRAVLVHFDAWGGPAGAGEWAEHVGYDDNVQAAIGIMARFGGGLADAEEHAHIGTIDVIAGVACAAATLRALLHRHDEGVVHTVRSSLAAVGQLLQLPFMCGGAAARATLGRGVRCRGEHALHACYRAADGWIVLVAGDDAADAAGWAALRRALPELVQAHADDAGSLAAAIAPRGADALVAALHAAGVGAARLVRLGELRTRCTRTRFDPRGGSYQFVLQPDHPIGALLMVAPVATRLWDAPLAPAPKYGAHTREVLTALRAYGTLLSGGAACAWSRSYMPFASACDRCGRRVHLIVLPCDHALCADCLPSCARCAVCGWHETDRGALRRAVLHWRGDYAAWRRGSARGARDMERRFVTPPDATTLRRCQTL